MIPVATGSPSQPPGPPPRLCRGAAGPAWHGRAMNPHPELGWGAQPCRWPGQPRPFLQPPPGSCPGAPACCPERGPAGRGDPRSRLSRDATATFEWMRLKRNPPKSGESEQPPCPGAPRAARRPPGSSPGSRLLLHPLKVHPVLSGRGEKLLHLFWGCREVVAGIWPLVACKVPVLRGCWWQPGGSEPLFWVEIRWVFPVRFSEGCPQKGKYLPGVSGGFSAEQGVGSRVGRA